MYLWDFHLMCDHALLDFSQPDWWEVKLSLAFWGLRKRSFVISISYFFVTFLHICGWALVKGSVVSACWSRELSYWDSFFPSHASQVTAELSSNFCFLHKVLWTVSLWGFPSCSLGGKQSPHSKHFKCRMQCLSRLLETTMLASFCPFVFVCFACF